MIEITNEHNIYFEQRLRETFLSLGLKECRLEKNYEELMIGPIFEEMSHVMKRAESLVTIDVIGETVRMLCDSIGDDYKKHTGKKHTHFFVEAVTINNYQTDGMEGILWCATVLLS